ncbi:MAG: hypothetical protein Q9168_003708 [Polycauliona sp. 1 TL-2023]
MRPVAFSVFLLSSVLALEPLSNQATSDNVQHLALRNLDLDRRQIQPAAVGAPAQAAAGAAQQPNGGAAAPAAAPVAPVANSVTPVAQTPTTKPITPVTPVTPAVPVVPTATPAVPATAITTPAVPAAPAAGGVGVVPVPNGPATALTSAPPPKSGTIGLGTLTGEVGVVKTDEARSEAGLAAGNKFGFIALWPSAFKVGASVLLGTAVGVGLLL